MASFTIITFLIVAVILMLPVPLVMLALAGTSLLLLLIPARARARWRHGRPRPAIHAWLRRAVYAADRHRCCYCHSAEQLQVDHVHPWSRGGLSSAWNLVTLCGHCNRVKSDYWATRHGEHYWPFDGHDDRDLARRILMRELRHRRSPLRWIRLAMALYGAA